MFPLTDQAVAGGNLDEADIGNQPADVRFVITELLGASQSAGTAVSGLVDPSRIAVVGHSDGAETALLVGYGASDRDPRVDAVVADAANPLDVQPPTAKIRGSAPLLIVLGDRDGSVPFEKACGSSTRFGCPDGCSCSTVPTTYRRSQARAVGLRSSTASRATSSWGRSTARVVSVRPCGRTRLGRHPR